MATKHQNPPTADEEQKKILYFEQRLICETGENPWHREGATFPGGRCLMDQRDPIANRFADGQGRPGHNVPVPGEEPRDHVRGQSPPRGNLLEATSPKALPSTEGTTHPPAWDNQLGLGRMLGVQGFWDLVNPQCQCSNFGVPRIWIMKLLNVML